MANQQVFVVPHVLGNVVLSHRVAPKKTMEARTFIRTSIALVDPINAVAAHAVSGHTAPVVWMSFLAVVKRGAVCWRA